VSEEREQPVLRAPSHAPLRSSEEPARHPHAGRRRLLLAVAMGLVAGTGYVGLRSAIHDDTPAPPSGSVNTSSDVGAEAAVRRATAGELLLQQMSSAIAGGDRAAFTGIVDPDATTFAPEAQQVFENLQALPLASIVMRYVSDNPDQLPADRRREIGGQEAWLAQVEVSWRLTDFDPQPVRLTVPMTLVTRDGSTYLSSLSDQVRPGQRRPFWLLGKIRAVRGERSLVVSLDPKADLAAYARTVDSAIESVTDVWGPNWRRAVVLYLPRTQSQMEYVLGARQHTYDQIAAVTTAEADERSVGVPVRIVANPARFMSLGTQGRRIVLTHETTHVASRATASAVPLWFAEGFADYVAFKAVDVPTGSAAKELLAAVRDGKGPKVLPEPAAFSASSKQLAIAYESSWLACQLIATKYGEDKLVRLYRTVHASRSPNGMRDGFRTVLNTTQEQFVADWLRYLRRLADD
jgi:hypothetical protein